MRKKGGRKKGGRKKGGRKKGGRKKAGRKKGGRKKGGVFIGYTSKTKGQSNQELVRRAQMLAFII
jgi:hypothetical protein